MTVCGYVHEVNRGGFNAKEQQRCLGKPKDWVKLKPGDARASLPTLCRGRRRRGLPTGSRP